MLITSVEKSKKYKDMLMVYVDGDYGFSIQEDEYIALNLYEKKDISEDEVEYIKGTINFNSAKSSAVRALSLKIRTEKEISSKLERDGYDKNTIGNVIDELKSIGYINDRIYVQKYIFDRSKLKPKAKKLLKLELTSKGIEEAVIDEVLSEWEVDEEETALGIARKKFGKYDFKDENIKKKVYAFLLHRGYNWEIANSVINRILESE